MTFTVGLSIYIALFFTTLILIVGWNKAQHKWEGNDDRQIFAFGASLLWPITLGVAIITIFFKLFMWASSGITDQVARAFTKAGL